jgi:signal transduction histidine kinase
MDIQKSYWKQSEEWAIGLKDNLFFRARIKLTLFYFLIISLIVIVFSVVIYHNLTADISDNFEGHFINKETQDMVFSRVKDQLQANILMIDFLVVIIATGLGYVLSGQTLKPIKKALAAQKQFTADAAHELRTPLAVMKTGIEVALASNNPTKDQLLELTKSNLEEVEKLSEHTEALLILARENEKKKEGKMLSLDICSLANKVITRLDIIAKQKSIEITFAGADSVFVLGSPEALETLLLNLVKNSIQYTPNGGSVTVEVKKQGSQVIVSIKDTGIGIEEKDLQHIFEPFYKADKSRAQFESGIGLGLSLVKKIADNHHAKLDVKSVLQKGTEVIITFEKLNSASS